MTHHVANLAAGFLLRVVQVLVDSSLYLVIGFLTAGAIRAMVGPDRTRRLFGSGRVAAPLRAWLAATTLLPTCALGVLPVLQEFRRAKVPRHAVLTFALAAPMLNPISLISCLSYLGPNLILVLLLGSLLVSVGAGVALGPGREPRTDEADDEFITDAPGRLGRATTQAARAATGPILRDVAAGLIGAGVMAAALSPSYLAASMFEGDRWAIGRMATIAPLTYATPDKAMATLPEMVKFRQSAGAMFVLVALGVGMTLGHLTWAARAYGIRAAARWLAVAFALTLAVAHGVAEITPAVGTANADNDHLNEFANEFEGAEQWPTYASIAGRYAREVEPFRWATLGALAGLVAAGAYCRATGRLGPPHAGLAPEPARRPAWDRPLPPRLVAAAGSCLMLAIGVVGAYTYFPPPAEVFEDMNIIKADFFGELGRKSLDPARHHLDLWERQAAKLTTGSLIRLAPASGEARRLTDALRADRRRLRAALDADKPAEARALSMEVFKVLGRCKLAYGRP